MTTSGLSLTCVCRQKVGVDDDGGVVVRRQHPAANKKRIGVSKNLGKSGAAKTWFPTSSLRAFHKYWWLLSCSCCCRAAFCKPQNSCPTCCCCCCYWTSCSPMGATGSCSASSGPDFLDGPEAHVEVGLRLRDFTVTALAPVSFSHSPTTCPALCLALSRIELGQRTSALNFNPWASLLSLFSLESFLQLERYFAPASNFLLNAFRNLNSCRIIVFFSLLSAFLFVSFRFACNPCWSLQPTPGALSALKGCCFTCTTLSLSALSFAAQLPQKATALPWRRRGCHSVDRGRGQRRYGQLPHAACTNKWAELKILLKTLPACDVCHVPHINMVIKRLSVSPFFSLLSLLLFDRRLPHILQLLPHAASYIPYPLPCAKKAANLSPHSKETFSNYQRSKDATAWWWQLSSSCCWPCPQGLLSLQSL